MRVMLQLIGISSMKLERLTAGYCALSQSISMEGLQVCVAVIVKWLLVCEINST